MLYDELFVSLSQSMFEANVSIFEEDENGELIAPENIPEIVKVKILHGPQCSSALAVYEEDGVSLLTLINLSTESLFLSDDESQDRLGFYAPSTISDGTGMFYIYLGGEEKLTRKDDLQVWDSFVVAAFTAAVRHAFNNEKPSERDVLMAIKKCKQGVLSAEDYDVDMIENDKEFQSVIEEESDKSDHEDDDNLRRCRWRSHEESPQKKTKKSRGKKTAKTLLAEAASEGNLVNQWIEAGSNRAFAIRSSRVPFAAVTKKSAKNRNEDVHAVVDVYSTRNIDDASLQPAVEIGSDKFTFKGQSFNPMRSLLQDGETKMILQDSQNQGNLYQMDINTEKVINQFSTNLTPHSILPDFEGAQLENHSVFTAFAPKAIFKLDTRIKDGGMDTNAAAIDSSGGIASRRQLANAQKTLTTKLDSVPMICGPSLTYASNPHISCAATTKSGFILAGSNKSGILRMYDGEINDSGNIKKSKNNIEDASLKGMVGVAVSRDEKIMLVTLEREIKIIVSTHSSNKGTTGFEKTFGKGVTQPATRSVSISPSDLKGFGLSFASASFIKAEFIYESANSSNIIGIVSAIGNYAIIWDYKQTVVNCQPTVVDVKRYDEAVVGVLPDNAEPKSIFITLPHKIVTASIDY